MCPRHARLSVTHHHGLKLSAVYWFRHFGLSVLARPALHSSSIPRFGCARIIPIVSVRFTSLRSVVRRLAQLDLAFCTSRFFVPFPPVFTRRPRLAWKLSFSPALLATSKHQCALANFLLPVVRSVRIRRPGADFWANHPQHDCCCYPRVSYPLAAHGPCSSLNPQTSTFTFSGWLARRLCACRRRWRCGPEDSCIGIRSQTAEVRHCCLTYQFHPRTLC